MSGRARRSQAGTRQPKEQSSMKGIVLWLLGVPVFVIIALYVFGIL